MPRSIEAIDADLKAKDRECHAVMVQLTTMRNTPTEDVNLEARMALDKRMEDFLPDINRLEEERKTAIEVRPVPSRDHRARS